MGADDVGSKTSHFLLEEERGLKNNHKLIFIKNGFFIILNKFAYLEFQLNYEWILEKRVLFHLSEQQGKNIQFIRLNKYSPFYNNLNEYVQNADMIISEIDSRYG